MGQLACCHASNRIEVAGLVRQERKSPGEQADGAPLRHLQSTLEVATSAFTEVSLFSQFGLRQSARPAVLP